MRKTFAPILAAAFAAAVSLGFAAPASADVLSECGSFNFSADSKCELVVSGGCTAQCEPINFTAQCTANAYVQCDGGCNVMIDAGCSAKCSADCSAKCEVDPPSFECSASCKADCSASCSGQCASSQGDAKTRCETQCRSTCGIDCDSKCKATPGSADCMAKCDASCSGSCHAQANMDCQINCQSDLSVDCESKLTGGCKTACEQPEGALFCDGQYVEVPSIDDCAAALAASLQIEVTGYADAECRGTSCTAEAGASCNCSAVGKDSDPRGAALGMMGALAAFGLALSRRKASKK